MLYIYATDYPAFSIFITNSFTDMKTTLRYFSIVALLCFATISSVFAQVPRQISYQGVIVDNLGAPIADGNHVITIKFYDASTGGPVLYSEPIAATSVKGLFNVILGVQSPIPPSLTFNSQYFIGISVDGGPELSPRTAMTTVPYALHAASADQATTLSTGVVNSINTQTGALTLVGAGGTTITNAAGVVTISSSGGGGSGIQGVQNTDGTMTITNPNGPTATIGLADGGVTAAKLGTGSVTTAKIADGAVTSAKIPANAVGSVQIAGLAVGTAQLADGAVTSAKVGSGVATNGQVLTANGTGGTSWTTVSGGGGLTLPYVGTVINAGDAFSVTNTGGGNAIYGKGTATAKAGIYGETSHATGVGVFGITSDGGTGSIQSNSGVCGSSGGGKGVSGITNTGDGVYGFAGTTGVGVHGIVGSASVTARAGYFENSSSTTANVLEAKCIGTGIAGYFQVNNASSTTAASWSTNNGGSSSVGCYGNNNGTGKAAFFEVVNGNSSSIAVQASTQGKGIALYVANYNAANSSDNLFSNTIGTGRAGNFQIANAGSTATSLESTTNGTSNSSHAIVGIHSATSGTGAGVRGETNSTTGNSFAVHGICNATSGGGFSCGVRGENASTTGSGIGVWGTQDGTGFGMYGTVTGNGKGVYGYCGGTTNGTGVYAQAPVGSWALYSNGKFEVSIDNAVKPSTNTWTIASDARLKTNIRPFTDGLDVLTQIRPVRYYYNGLAGTPTENENIGIIAQEMQKIAPYTVGTSNVKLHPEDTQQTEILNYNSHAITYVTINAVKELNERVKMLEAKLLQMEQILQQRGFDTNPNVVIK